MTAVVLRGDARRLPLPDGCADLIVTSPPYFGLRSYTDTCNVCRAAMRDGIDPRTAFVNPSYDEHVRRHHHYDGQIGSEATPAEWLAALVACTAEWVRVLKPSGSIFVNLGDKYAGGGQGGNVGGHLNGGPHLNRTPKQARVVPPGAREKSLLGLPWRYALACMDQLGLILRRDIIWSKPNGLPESVTDRCRSSHEYLFHFTVQPRYYAAVDEIREPSATAAHHAKYAGRYEGGWDQTRTGGPWSGHASLNPLGKLPGSVWSIPSQPLTVPAALGVDHFAAFPMELPRRCVLGWSPPGVCTACGEGRRPVRGVDWSKVPHRMVEKRALTTAEAAEWCTEFADWCDAAGIGRADLDAAAGTSDMGGWWASRLPHRSAVPTPEQWAKLRSAFGPPSSLDAIVHLTRIVPVAERDMVDADRAGRNRATGGGLGVAVMSITGYACACPEPDAPVRPAVVVDPFGGTGTTALVASVYGRTGLSFDLSADYCRLARWRTRDPAERARALLVPKPPPVPDGQGSLFDEAS